MFHRLVGIAFGAALLTATLATAADRPEAATVRPAAPTPVQLFLIDPGTDPGAGRRLFEALLNTPQKSLAAGPTCTFVDQICSSCAGGKIRSCDRYRCGSPNPVIVDECTPCTNFC